MVSGVTEVCVKIPEDLYKRAEEVIKKNKLFKSVDEMVKFLLEESISSMTAPEGYSEEEEEEVKERLRSLGYL